MKEHSDKTTLYFVIIIICISCWYNEHVSYNKLKNEYLEYVNFVHETVDRFPRIAHRIYDYESYLDDVKQAEIDNNSY